MVNHLSFSGEMGYQIYCKLQYLMLLANEIEDFGADLVCRWYGARAFMSMRLEKGWVFWRGSFGLILMLLSLVWMPLITGNRTLWASELLLLFAFLALSNNLSR